MRMVIVYYMNCVLVKAFSIIVMYEDGAMLYEDSDSILDEECPTLLVVLLVVHYNKVCQRSHGKQKHLANV